MLAFVDESKRRRQYLLAAVVVPRDQAALFRRSARRLLLGGERRFHMCNEQPRRRRHALAVLEELGPTVVIVTTTVESRRREEAARRRCLDRLLIVLCNQKVDTVLLERRDEARDRDERRFLSRVLPAEVSFRHTGSTEEPILWWADVAAWWGPAGCHGCDLHIV